MNDKEQKIVSDWKEARKKFLKARVLRLAGNAGLDDAELDELVRARGGKTEAEYQELRRELDSIKEELRGLLARLEQI